MRIDDVLKSKGGKVVKVGSDAKVSEAARLLSHWRIGALIVEDKWMKIVGVLSERDFVNAMAHHGARALDLEVRELMTTALITMRPDDRIDDALALMLDKRIRHLPVMENGHLIGIVSIGDLVKARLDEKELEANVLLDIARLHG